MFHVAEGRYAMHFPLFEDNEGAIQIAKHPISNSNSKHIDVRHHVLRAFVERKDCLLYTSPSPRDLSTSRMPSSA